jgi:hypothetical protein
MMNSEFTFRYSSFTYCHLTINITANIPRAARSGVFVSLVLIFISKELFVVWA